MDRGQFVGWLYEEAKEPRDSVVVARAIFFSHIPELRARIVFSLVLDVFPSFLNLVSDTFKKQADIDQKTSTIKARPFPPAIALWTGTLSVLGRIPGADVKTAVGSWATVSQIESAKNFRSKLEEWASAQNLNVEWCYDLAIRILSAWMADQGVMLAGELDNASLGQELSRSWQTVMRGLQIGWDWDRQILYAAVHFKAKEFKFGYRVLPKRSLVPAKKQLFFRAPGWYVLTEGRAEWTTQTSARFEQFIKERTEANDPPKLGTRGRFRKALAAYVKRMDAEAQKTITRYGLVKPPTFYGSQNIHVRMQQLVRFQIPKCESYKEISQDSGIQQTAVCKNIQRTAALIGLTLRRSKSISHPLTRHQPANSPAATL